MQNLLSYLSVEDVEMVGLVLSLMCMLAFVIERPHKTTKVAFRLSDKGNGLLTLHSQGIVCFIVPVERASLHCSCV